MSSRKHRLHVGPVIHAHCHRRKLVKISGGGSRHEDHRRSWGHHGECSARAYNGGLGAEPPAGSRGSPPEAESILVI